MLICIYYYDDVFNILIETVILFKDTSIIRNLKRTEFTEIEIFCNIIYLILFLPQQWMYMLNYN